MKSGFYAYKTIENLAKTKFPNDEVQVVASIFGDDYEIKIGDKVITGTSDNVLSVLRAVQS